MKPAAKYVHILYSLLTLRVIHNLQMAPLEPIQILIAV